MYLILKWEFTGNISEKDYEQLPNELVMFLRWVLQGTSKLHSNHEEIEIDKSSRTIAQHIMYSYKTIDQMRYKQTHPSVSSRLQKESPLQVGLGLAVHQYTRSKTLIDMFHDLNLAVNYSRVLQIETQLANSVIVKIERDKIYIPRNVVLGKFVSFAIDNTDFNEDTPDGKRTFHGTLTAVYQRKEMSEARLPLEYFSTVSRETKMRPFDVTLGIQTFMFTPRSNPLSPVIQEFKPNQRAYTVMEPYSNNDVL